MGSEDFREKKPATWRGDGLHALALLEQRLRIFLMPVLSILCRWRQYCQRKLAQGLRDRSKYYHCKKEARSRRA